jgi:type VI secretion system protein ImpM
MGNFRPTAIGFFGKLPARGDFLRANLPEDFIAPLDAWCRECLTASRAGLGAQWQEAWMTAPIWHFLLPAGACGAQAVLGVWLPSMDKVGRHFPFLLCALAPAIADLQPGADWADLAQTAGLSGVLDDMPHETILDSLHAAVPDRMLPPPGWWTQGSPLVQPRRFDIASLLPARYATAMLHDQEPAQ